MVWYYPIPFLPWPIQRLTHHLKALFSKECKLNSANEWSLCVCVCTITQVCVLVAQPCLTLCDPTDCNPPGSSIHGILQARVPEWVAIAFFRGSSWPRDRTQISHIEGRHFTIWATRDNSCSSDLKCSGNRGEEYSFHLEVEESYIESLPLTLALTMG